MATDCKGVEVNRGDEVILRCRVVETFGQGGIYCDLRTVLLDRSGYPKDVKTLSTSQLERVGPGDSRTTLHPIHPVTGEAALADATTAGTAGTPQ